MVLRLNWLVASLFFIQIQFVAASQVSKNPGPQFKKEYIQLDSKLGSKKILVEIAETDLQLQHGLMHRDFLKPDQGMLFIFKNEQILSFWMKNTFIDLSIGYFDEKKTLNEVIEMKSTSLLQTELASYPSRKLAMYALEMNKGWFDKNKIKLKTKFKFLDRKN